ncbi:UNVERIFIED_CONTAM: hypothetical protein FKN15_014324 [Acipenser sinensis]
MDMVWMVALCLIFLAIIVVLLSMRKTDDSGKTEGKDKPVSPAVYSSARVGKKLEFSPEELDRYLDRLTGVVFSGDVAVSRDQPRRRVPGEPQQHKPVTATSESEKPSHPSDMENILSEIEQAVQETVDSGIGQRRRRREAAGIRTHTEHRIQQETAEEKHTLPPP